MQDWIRTNRLLVLAEHSNESALLVYILLKNVTDSLNLERVIPVDAEFRCEIGQYRTISAYSPDSWNPVFAFCLPTDTSNSKNLVSTDVFLKVTRKKVHLLFEMMPGFKANKFVDEVVRATESNR